MPWTIDFLMVESNINRTFSPSFVFEWIFYQSYYNRTFQIISNQFFFCFYLLSLQMSIDCCHQTFKINNIRRIWRVLWRFHQCSMFVKTGVWLLPTLSWTIFTVHSGHMCTRDVCNILVSWCGKSHAMRNHIAHTPNCAHTFRTYRSVFSWLCPTRSVANGKWYVIIVYCPVCVAKPTYFV